MQRRLYFFVHIQYCYYMHVQEHCQLTFKSMKFGARDKRDLTYMRSIFIWPLGYVNDVKRLFQTCKLNTHLS